MGKKTTICLTIIVCFFASLTLFCSDSFAVDSITLNKIKAYNYGVTCFKQLKDTITVDEAHNYLMYGGRDNFQGMIFAGQDGGHGKSAIVPMPNSGVTGLDGNIASSPMITCQEFIFGGIDGWGGIIHLSDYNSSVSAADLEPNYDIGPSVSFLKKLGYEASQSTDSGTKCLKVSLSSTAELLDIYGEGGRQNFFDSDAICFDAVKENGVWKVDMGSISEEGTPSEHSLDFVAEPLYRSSGELKSVSVVAKFSHFGDNHDVTDYIPGNASWGEYPKTSNVNTGEFRKHMETWESVMKKIQDYLDGWTSYSNYVAVVQDVQTADSADSDVNIVTKNTVFKKKQSYDATQIAVGSAGVNLTAVEVYNVYAEYLSNGAFVGILCGAENLNTSYESIKIKVDGEIKECLVSDVNGGRLYTGVEKLEQSSVNLHLVKKNMTLHDIVTQINGLNLNLITNEINDVNPNATITPGNGENEVSSGVDQNCQTGGGASSLGWIICPMLTWLGNAADGLYTNVVAPILTINPQLFSVNDENSGTRKGWGTFRDIANFLFIGFFLFVIFSQLTGLGIDNYGIKKVLPKMIVTAVLINLSFLICTLLVDLSNITGTGFQSMFKGLSNQLQETTITLEDTEVGQNGMPQTITIGENGIITNGAQSSQSNNESSGGGKATALTVVGIIAILVAVVGSIWQNPAILLSLLIAAIGVVVSILFLFVLLAVRQALIVVLTVVSPVAIICYMLPNTKKIFDKWWKLFQGLLLLFPICGLLVGGGDYASRLLIGSGMMNNGFFSALIAMLVGIVPIFFIPTVLKGSFDAMGKVGGMLSGLGSKARKATTGGLKDSSAVKNLQKSAGDRRELLRARRRSGGRMNENGQFVEGGLRSRFARSRIGHAIGADRRMSKNRQDFVKRENERRDDMSYIEGRDAMANADFDTASNARMRKVEAANVGVVAANRDNVRTELQNERIKQEEQNQVGVVAASRENIRRDLENERIKAEMEIEVGPKPILNRDTLRVRMQNAIDAARADTEIADLRVNADLARERRQAAVDAQTIRSYGDQFGTLTRAGMNDQLNKAVSDYSSDRNHENGLRLQAAIMEAEKRGMNKEMLDNSLAGLRLSVVKNPNDPKDPNYSHREDNKILDTLAGSRDIVLSQYGKQMSKWSGQNLSVDDFAGSQGSVKLSDAFSGIGSNALNSANDDTLDYLRRKGSTAVTGKMLWNKALSTSSGKELTKVKDMINNSDAKLFDDTSFSLSGSELTGIDNSILTELAGKLANDGAPHLQQEFISATNDIARSPELLGKLNTANKAILDNIRKNAGLGPMSSPKSNKDMEWDGSYDEG